MMLFCHSCGIGRREAWWEGKLQIRQIWDGGRGTSWEMFVIESIVPESFLVKNWRNKLTLSKVSFQFYMFVIEQIVPASSWSSLLVGLPCKINLYHISHRRCRNQISIWAKPWSKYKSSVDTFIIVIIGNLQIEKTADKLDSGLIKEAMQSKRDVGKFSVV